MGVLDDAIREHLELKRRHGAAEEDLRRQEVEALGPARRQVVPEEAEDTDGAGGQEPAEVEAAAAEDAGPVAEEAGLPGVDASEPAAEEPLGEFEEPATEEPHAEMDESLAGVEDRHAEQRHAELDEPVADEPALSDPPVEHPLSDADLPETQESSAIRHGDTPPRGFEALDDDDELLDEDEPASEEPAGDDPDVLEDTPDFLQETPEHDRLWFEQKPPRDFDFD